MLGRLRITIAESLDYKLQQLQQITALGVTLSYNFSMAKHIDTVMSSCARTLYGLRTLRAHGMPQAALQLVFQSIADL